MTSATQSAISKTVDESETEQIFTFLSFGEVVMSLVGVVFLTEVYNLVLPISPGLLFIIEGCVYLLLMIFFVVFFIVVSCLKHENDEECKLVDGAEKTMVYSTSREKLSP